MEHNMKVMAVYFDKIVSGEKTYEIRLNDIKRQQLDVGDTLVIHRAPDLNSEVRVKILDLIYFKDFDKMLEALPADKIGFAGFDKSTIADIYRGFYSLEDEVQYGVVAIKIKLIK